MNLEQLLKQAEENAFDIEPWPQCAPANFDGALMPFKYMTPSGNGYFQATFHIDEEIEITCAAVRYGTNPPVYLSVDRCLLTPTDILHLNYRPG